MSALQKVKCALCTHYTCRAAGCLSAATGVLLHTGFFEALWFTLASARFDEQCTHTHTHTDRHNTHTHVRIACCYHGNESLITQCAYTHLQLFLEHPFLCVLFKHVIACIHTCASSKYWHDAAFFRQVGKEGWYSLDVVQLSSSRVIADKSRYMDGFWGQKCDLWSLVITLGDQFSVSSGERREGEGVDYLQ